MMKMQINLLYGCTTSLAGAALGTVIFLFAPAAANAQSPCGPTTTVQSGDTYFGIAQRCDVSVDVIERANPSVDRNNLQVGQTLQLTVESGADAPSPDGRYEVRAGDTAFSIAQALGVTVEALLAANPGIDPYALQIGQVLTPPAYGAPGDPGSGTQVSGILTPEGVECQGLRGHDGQFYTLIGDLEGYDDGDVVQVRGEVQEVSFCQQGTTIEIDSIRSAG